MVAVDAELVRERKAYPLSGGVSDLGRVMERLLAMRLVIEIALEVRDLCTLYEVGIDIGNGEADAGTQVGVHRALRVGGHQDQTPGRSRPVSCRNGTENGSRPRYVAPKRVAQFIIADFADVARGAAHLGNPRHRVAGRSTGGYGTRSHGPVDVLGPLLVDE